MRRAPDETTLAYLKKTPAPPTPEERERWSDLRSDEGAHFDRKHQMEVSKLAPMITWGTHPALAIPIDGALPPRSQANASAFSHTGVEPGSRLLGQPIDAAFIGSCTNGRIEDLRQAARILDGR